MKIAVLFKPKGVPGEPKGKTFIKVKGLTCEAGNYGGCDHNYDGSHCDLFNEPLETDYNNKPMSVNLRCDKCVKMFGDGKRVNIHD